MKQTPKVYAPVVFTEWETDQQHPITGQWIPARPYNPSGLRYLVKRLRIAWKVFTGEYDALDWSKSSYSEVCDMKSAQFKHRYLSYMVAHDLTYNMALDDYNAHVDTHYDDDPVINPEEAAKESLSYYDDGR